jgi:O-antigen ligase
MKSDDRQNRVSFAILIALVFALPLMFIPEPFPMYRTPRMVLFILFALTLVNVFAIELFFSKNCRLSRTPADIPIILFIAFLGVYTALAPIKGGATVYFAQFPAIAAVFFVASSAISSKKRISTMTDILIAVCVLLSIIGILENFGIEFWTWPIDWGERVDSTFDDPNLFGGYIGMGCALALSKAIQPNISPSLRAARFFSLAVIVMALIFSYSRSAWLATACSLLAFAIVVFIRRREFFPTKLSKAVAVLIVIAFIAPAALIAIPRANPYSISIAKRVSTAKGFLDEQGYLKLSYWSAAIEMMKDRPAWGVGLTNFSRFYPAYSNQTDLKYNPHGMTYDAYNDYFELGAEGGVPALLCYLATIVIFFSASLRTVLRKQTEIEARVLTLGIMCAAIVFAFQCFFFQFPMKNLPQFLNFWLLMAMGFALMKQSEVNEDESATASKRSISGGPRVIILVALLAASVVFAAHTIRGTAGCALLYRQTLIEGSKGLVISAAELGKKQIEECPPFFNEKLYLYLAHISLLNKQCGEAREILDSGLKFYPHNRFMIEFNSIAKECENKALKRNLP